MSDFSNVGSRTMGLPVTRTSLLSAVSRDPAAPRWAEFDSIYRGIVFGMARKAGLRPEDASDLTQEVFVELMRSLQERFEIREQPGSFRKYLANLVRWRVSTRREEQAKEESRRTAVEEEEENESWVENLPDPSEVKALTGREIHEVITQAFESMARELKPKTLQLLDLYYRQECTAREVANVLGMESEATVHTIAYRARRRLASEISRRL